MKANKEMLHREFNKIWGTDTRMSSYCTNKVSTMAILPDGGIVPVDKQRLEKDFCFGESGYDMDDAIAAADHARTSQEYFLSQNMRSFNSWIADLKDARDENGRYKLLILDTHYIDQPADCKIRAIEFVKVSAVLEKTGPAFLKDLYGIEFGKGHLATIEEIDAIIEAYKEAAKDHEKKVLSYLKRYGTSKVHAWTYWRDA